MVSSPSEFQQCFTKNDIILANRSCFLSGNYIFYNYTTLGSISYGEHWIRLDDNYNSVVLPYAKVIQYVLSYDVNENYFDILEYNAKPSNILPLSEDSMDNETEGKHTIQDDVVVYNGSTCSYGEFRGLTVILHGSKIGSPPLSFSSNIFTWAPVPVPGARIPWASVSDTFKPPFPGRHPNLHPEPRQDTKTAITVTILVGLYLRRLEFTQAGVMIAHGALG
ncbi:hypothetical protein VNO77_04317 [Canavalia gladiata]|uniref:Uncharacterized protein n=1 Tax=Canavalia gladiata TaxID=3824 RepID=A0AAN9R7N2_CANGL